MKLNDILSVILGHAMADAMGVPYEFMKRADLERAPATRPEGYGTHNQPVGSFSDDTSMSLATLDSLKCGYLDFNDIMLKFADWYFKDEYTACGEMFDIGGTTERAITNFIARETPLFSAAPDDEYSNGNGALMRIHPIVLYLMARDGEINENNVYLIERASALTHAHRRSMVGCGIFAFVLGELILDPKKESIRVGLDKAYEHYKNDPELYSYSRIFNMNFKENSVHEIKSSGYIVDTLEAAIWCLMTGETYSDTVLSAINLGGDTDTVGAVTGALSGALFGLDSIPGEWLSVLRRLDYITELCHDVYQSLERFPKDSGFIDLHLHIVPGVDDGAADLEMAKAMLKRERRQGVVEFFCTSHSTDDTEVLEQYKTGFSEVSEYARGALSGCRLHTGCEVLFDKSNYRYRLDMIKRGLLPTLANSNYVLCEFDPMEKESVISLAASALTDSGYIPVIAHAERYLASDNLNFIDALISSGAMIQANAYSFVEESSEEIKARARALLSAEKIHFLGSDAHRTTHRPPNLTEGIRYIFYNSTPEYARAVLRENAKNYILKEQNISKITLITKSDAEALPASEISFSAFFYIRNELVESLRLSAAPSALLSLYFSDVSEDSLVGFDGGMPSPPELARMRAEYNIISKDEALRLAEFYCKIHDTVDRIYIISDVGDGRGLAIAHAIEESMEAVTVDAFDSEKRYINYTVYEKTKAAFAGLI